MNTSENTRGSSMTDTDTPCTLPSPLVARIPGMLSVAVIPAAIFLSPFFFGLAGGLLAFISLLLSPPHSRRLGFLGLIGAVASGSLGVLLLP